ncbi:MAG: hypothetical protein RIQ81_2387 [Pseudomonadota bacterium]
MGVIVAQVASGGGPQRLVIKDIAGFFWPGLGFEEKDALVEFRGELARAGVADGGDFDFAAGVQNEANPRGQDEGTGIGDFLFQDGDSLFNKNAIGQFDFVKNGVHWGLKLSDDCGKKGGVSDRLARHLLHRFPGQGENEAVDLFKFKGVGGVVIVFGGIRPQEVTRSPDASHGTVEDPLQVG